MLAFSTRLGCCRVLLLVAIWSYSFLGFVLECIIRLLVLYEPDFVPSIDGLVQYSLR